MTTPRTIALIPARSGSSRLPDKNVRQLGEHPLIAYTIAAARRARVFARVIVSTDSDAYAEIAAHYGAEVPWRRPAALATGDSLDIDWVRHVLEELRAEGDVPDAFSILRPTSPFRTSGTIRRAFRTFCDADGDSLRAVERCSQHPAKMWVLGERFMRPLLDGGVFERPWHSSPYQSLRPVWVQNASLEMVWTRVVEKSGTIAGSRIVPFATEGREGFDINTPDDWILAEALVRTGEAALPAIDDSPQAVETLNGAA